jgi:hypothetical protein
MLYITLNRRHSPYQLSTRIKLRLIMNICVRNYRHLSRDSSAPVIIRKQCSLVAYEAAFYCDSPRSTIVSAKGQLELRSEELLASERRGFTIYLEILGTSNASNFERITKTIRLGCSRGLGLKRQRRAVYSSLLSWICFIFFACFVRLSFRVKDEPHWLQVNSSISPKFLSAHGLW